MHNHKSTSGKIGPILAISAIAGVAIAGGPFQVNEWTIDGGGGLSTGGDFQVYGTLGQPDAGQPMTGGGFEVVGGFWAAASCPTDLNGNGVVDLGDLNIVLGSFGSGSAGDINGDGVTNLADLNLILSSFGNPC